MNIGRILIEPLHYIKLIISTDLLTSLATNIERTLATLDEGTREADGLLTYLNTWTRSNHSLSAEFLLKYVKHPRILVWYAYTTTRAICLATTSMPWQNMQRWSLTNCTVKEEPLLLDYRDPVANGPYTLCDIL